MDPQPKRLAAQLLARACAGDACALAELLLGFRGELVQAIAALAGERICARVEPEDLFQEASLQAMRSIGSLRSRDLAGFRRWFRGIARHRILDFVGASEPKAQPRLTTPLPDSLLAFQAPERLPEIESPEGRVSGVRDETRAVVRRLGSSYRMTLVLRNVFGSHWDTVAFVMERKNPRCARHTHLRARLRMRHSFGCVT